MLNLAVSTLKSAASALNLARSMLKPVVSVRLLTLAALLFQYADMNLQHNLRYSSSSEDSQIWDCKYRFVPIDVMNTTGQLAEGVVFMRFVD